MLCRLKSCDMAQSLPSLIRAGPCPSVANGSPNFTLEFDLVLPTVRRHTEIAYWSISVRLKPHQNRICRRRIPVKRTMLVRVGEPFKGSSSLIIRIRASSRSSDGLPVVVHDTATEYVSGIQNEIDDVSPFTEFNTLQLGAHAFSFHHNFGTDSVRSCYSPKREHPIPICFCLEPTVTEIMKLLHGCTRNGNALPVSDTACDHESSRNDQPRIR